MRKHEQRFNIVGDRIAAWYNKTVTYNVYLKIRSYSSKSFMSWNIQDSRINAIEERKYKNE